MSVTRLMGRLAAATVVVFTSLVMSVASPAESGDEVTPAAVFKPGDIAVTGFSGTVLATDKLPLGVDPLDRTFIDLSAPSLRIFDASSLSGTPAGQLINAPPRLDVPAKDIGQVFALAIDPSDNGGPPRIFAAATSAFGLRIVGAGRAADGKPIRLKAGAPDASFMDGQFGALSSNSPGAIYKIDGATGAVTYLADTAFSGILNSGPGIGGLAYDPKSRTLFASDLDSGLIHRFGLEYNAADLGQYDHGVTGRRSNGLEAVSDDGSRLDIASNDFKADDPATWGFTQPARRVDALAVHDGRLYYSVAEGPEIWSVGLNGGAFLTDARREVSVKAEKPFPITAIAFDASGRMLLAQRGPVKSPYDYGSFTETGAQVFRYTPETPDDPNTPGLWREDPATYAVGTADNSNAGSGGISLQYGYRPDGFIDLNTCDGAVAATGDTLSTTASGVQLNALELVRPANVPPAQSAFIDYNPQQGDPDVRGHVGSVAALRLCGVEAGFPPIAEGAAPVEGGDAFPPVAGGGADGGGAAFPPVEDASGGGTASDEGGGETFPPVEDGGDGTTTADGGQTAEAGGISITKSAVPGTCTEKGGCAFNIDVTNNSGADLPEIVVGDELTGGAANLGGATIEGAAPAPWECTAPPKFTCTHKGTIKNGETVSLPLSFVPKGIGQEKELKNCATAQPAGAGPAPANKLGAGPPNAGTATNKGLKVELVPVSPKCSTSTGGCTWEAKATNVGDKTLEGEFKGFFTSNITTEENKSLLALLVPESVTAPAGIQCTLEPANKTLITCTGKTNLAAGQTISIPIKVKATINPNVSRFMSADYTASIGTANAGPVRSFMNLDGPDAAPIQNPLAPVDTPVGAVDFKVRALSDNCDPAIGCEWELTGTNTGPAVTGDLRIELRQSPMNVEANTAATGGALKLLSFTSDPALPCTAAPNVDDEILCQQKNFTFAANQKLTLRYKVTSAKNNTKEAVRSSVNVDFADKSGRVQDVVKTPAGLAADAAAGGGAGGAAGGGGAGAADANGQPANGANDQAADAPNGAPAAPVGPVCATLPVEQPETPKPSTAGQISLLKTGVSCKDNRICTFNFAVTNTSATDFDGEVEFDDSITGDGAIFGATAITPAPAAPWTCPKNGQGFKCTAKLKIPANGAAPPLTLTFDLGPGIGAVQNVENCATLKDAPAKTCATLPMNAPGPQPGQQGQLQVAKEALVNSCSALGGGCLFKVTVKNPGPGDFDGDIEFDDDATFLDKKLKIALNSSLPNGCKHDGQGSLHCKIPGPLKAGDPPLEFTFNMVPQETTDAESIRNCVTLAGAANKTCAEIPLRKDKTPLLRATKKLESGDCAPECTFVISVRNVGEGEFNGTFAFFDEAMKVGPNKFSPFERLNAEVIATNASNGVTCPTGANPICSFTGKIEPNGTVSATFKMVAIDKQFTGLNCGSVSGNNVDNTQNRERCVQINRDAKTEKPFANLSIEKRNASPGTKGADHCELKKECLFIIRVTNTGTGDFTGPIKVTDTISLGVPEVIEEGPGGNLGWKCTTAKNGKGGIATNQSIDCEIPGAPNPLKPGTFVPLAPGKFIELGISVKPGSTWQNSNSINNCAEFVPLGNDLGPLTADKKKCASQRLDPFKVKVAKTGDQSCRPGSECRFELDIFNDEQIVHDDPVTVSDRLSGLSSAQVVSITPQAGADPFPCTPAPTEIPFTCTGHMNLTPGEHNKYVMIVRLPADAGAQSFSNCATIGDTAAGDGASDPSCHSVQLNPPQHASKLKIEKTGPASCEPGSECAFDLTISNPGQTEHHGAVTLIDGLSGVDAMTIASVDPPLPCAQQPKEIPFNCRTADDFTLPAGGKRTFRVTARIPRSADTFTNCAIISAGKAPGGAGGSEDVSSCVTVKTQTAAPPEQRKKPECKGGMILLDEGACACPPDTEWNGRNCVTRRPQLPPIENNAGGGDTTAPVNVCPRSLPVGTYPNCCERNTHFDPRINPPRGACVPNKRGTGDGGANTSKGGDDKTTEKPVCRTPRPIGNWPNCCPTGTHFLRGVCRPDKSPTGDGGANTSKGGDDKTTEKPVCKPPRPIGNWPNCCPTGTHFLRGACRPDKSPSTDDGTKGDKDGPKCPTGTIGRPPNCKCPLGMTGSPPNCCPPGTRFQNGKCVKPPVKCPPGTHLSRSGQCIPDATPQQPPPKTEPPKEKCSRGMVGTPPNCFCPPPRKLFHGRCTMPPKPTTPKCSGATPFGTPPNCCGASEWNSKTKRCEKYQGPK